MPWLQIKFAATPVDVDAVADALTNCGALSVSIEGSGDEMSLQGACEAMPLWRDSRITGLFAHDVDAHFVLGAVRAALGRDAVAHRIDALDDADWASAWMAHYRPVQIAANLWIVPSWCRPPDPHAVNVVLDPGLAFGTGAHPSTALCLAWLASQPLRGRTVIDYGCGSGILAIAALKLGAARAIGVDVDAQAINVSRENALRNGAAERYTACAPQALPADILADVLVANILAVPLVELAPELLTHITPRGRIALSGILAEQAADVRAVYAPHFALQAQEREGWALLTGPRSR